MHVPQNSREELLAAGANALLQAAWNVALGHDGVVMAAESAAAGSVAATDDLSDRERTLLAVGCLAGAGGAIARYEHPFEDGNSSVERVDWMLDLARAKDIPGRELSSPIFALLSPLHGEEEG